MGHADKATDPATVTRPRFIYITGADGTGKSTQARLLMDHLRSRGIQCRHLWLRFPFFFSLPLLVYARWRGYSWYEVDSGVRHGYWDFRNSWGLRVFLPWVLFLDATLAALRRVYIPLWLGSTFVCERFVLDMLVDLAVAFDDGDIHLRLPGRLYMDLLPRDTVVILLDLDSGTIRERRADLRADRRLEARLQAFRSMATVYPVPVLSSRVSVEEVNQNIEEMIRIR
jgi:thymidylate kinase